MVERYAGFRDYLKGIPITDVPRLRNLVEVYKENKEFKPEWFFSMALLGYYDAMHGGLNPTAGHILYRLSIL